MFTSLESDRLRLRRFLDSDLEPFLAYRNDVEVARYQSWESISAPRARAFIQEQMRLQPGMPGEWFQFALQHKANEQLVGDCGLQVLLHDVRQAQLGITLATAYQGQGLATEAVTAVLDYSFIELDLHRVITVVDCLNTASVALFERIGMRREGHFRKNVWFKGRWADEYLFAVLQAEWLPRRGGLLGGQP